VNGRRANGEGTIYRRKDGRWEGAVYLRTAAGALKRVRFYGQSRELVHEKLVAALAKSHRGEPTPDRPWTVGTYLDYWLESIVRPNLQPKTFVLYESTIRLHLLPLFAKRSLLRLSVAEVQACLNRAGQAGRSVRTLHLMKNVLAGALTHAMREELVSRNVARLVTLPRWEPKEVRPWTAAEASRFLRITESEPLYPAFLMLVLYGLRRGEVLGLRWQDCDFDVQQLRVRQQVQRIGSTLVIGPVKTRAGRRDLPMLPAIERVLRNHLSARRAVGASIQPEALVFTSRNGHPIEPRNLVRSFHRLCELHDLRKIKLHALRHTAATLLKNAGVQPRDAQLILGHADVITTQQIYQHADHEQQSTGLLLVHELISSATTQASRQLQPSRLVSAGIFTTFQSRGPGGTRTLDTLLKRNIQSTESHHLTELNLLLQSSVRVVLLGAAAVMLSRQFDDP
jgi:integrase